MLKINILTYKNYNFFRQAFDYNKYGRIFEYHENSSADIVWDLVVVYENVSKPVTVKCREGGIIFISGEPPLSKNYPREFLKQFDFVITTHKNIRHNNFVNSQLGLNWHYGLSHETKLTRYSFEDLESLKRPSKPKLISVITSSKEMMPGHNYRIKIIQRLKEDFSDYIDFYGKGSNFIDCKSDAINPYKFHICMENTMVNHYWSEKFADPLLGYSVPIYSGCPNISEYFDTKGFFIFDMKNYNSIREVIERILKNPEKVYEECFDSLEKNRDLLLHKYTIFDVINTFIAQLTISASIKEVSIKPYESCRFYKELYYIMALKRRLLKFIIRIR